MMIVGIGFVECFHYQWRHIQATGGHVDHDTFAMEYLSIDELLGKIVVIE